MNLLLSLLMTIDPDLVERSRLWGGQQAPGSRSKQSGFGFGGVQGCLHRASCWQQLQETCRRSSGWHTASPRQGLCGQGLQVVPTQPNRPSAASWVSWAAERASPALNSHALPGPPRGGSAAVGRSFPMQLQRVGG